MSYNDNIPLDPEKNLERLQGIGCHLASKLVRKESLLDRQLHTINQLQNVIDDLDDSPSSQTELEDASRREQILLGYKYDLSILDDEISTLKGRLKWNERMQDKVSNTAAMKSELKHQPFKNIQTEE